jgi:hypothetical protein
MKDCDQKRKDGIFPSACIRNLPAWLVVCFVVLGLVLVWFCVEYAEAWIFWMAK